MHALFYYYYYYFIKIGSEQQQQQKAKIKAQFEQLKDDSLKDKINHIKELHIFTHFVAKCLFYFKLVF